MQLISQLFVPLHFVCRRVLHDFDQCQARRRVLILITRGMKLIGYLALHCNKSSTLFDSNTIMYKCANRRGFVSRYSFQSVVPEGDPGRAASHIILMGKAFRTVWHTTSHM